MVFPIAIKTLQVYSYCVINRHSTRLYIYLYYILSPITYLPPPIPTPYPYYRLPWCPLRICCALAAANTYAVPILSPTVVPAVYLLRICRRQYLYRIYIIAYRGARCVFAAYLPPIPMPYLYYCLPWCPLWCPLRICCAFAADIYAVPILLPTVLLGAVLQYLLRICCAFAANTYAVFILLPTVVPGTVPQCLPMSYRGPSAAAVRP